MGTTLVQGQSWFTSKSAKPSQRPITTAATANRSTRIFEQLWRLISGVLDKIAVERMIAQSVVAFNKWPEDVESIDVVVINLNFEPDTPTALADCILRLEQTLDRIV